MELLLRYGNTEESFQMVLKGEGSWRCSAKGACFTLSHAASKVAGHKIVRLEMQMESLDDWKRSELPEWIGVSGFQLPQSTEQALANGYQCWSESPLLSKQDSLNAETNPDQVFYGDDALWEYAKEPGHFHSWSFSYLVGSEYAGQPLIASLCEDRFLALFEFDLHQGAYRAWLDTEGATWNKGNTFLHSWLVPDAEATSFASLGEVASAWVGLIAVHREIGSWNPPKQGQVHGYCSWYRHYTDVTEEKLCQDLNDWSGSQSIGIFQIDDGYQRVPGDWDVPHDGFDEGSLARVVASVTSADVTPGIWMAPFIVHSKAELFSEHPEWLLKDLDGSLVQCGNHGLWGGPFYALDSEYPEVRAFVRGHLQRWKGMGFGFVKLDFLYASSMIPSNGKTRAERGASAHQWLSDTCRELELELLSCGAVLSAAYGRSDFCRIGPDVAPQWEWEEQRHFFSREKISTRASIVNAITRKLLDGLLLRNDCDVSILRADGHGLTIGEQRALLEANLICSSLVFTSDSPSLCTGEHKALLERWIAGGDWKNASAVTKVTVQNGLYGIEFQDGATLSVLLIEGSPQVDFSFSRDERLVAGSLRP
jgi:alpha-galactosidase